MKMKVKRVMNVEQENKWDELIGKYADGVCPNAFQECWEEVVCDTANYLKFMKYFPEKTHDRKMPIQITMEIMKAYQELGWMSEGYTAFDILQCASWIWNKHRAFILDHVQDFLESYHEKAEGGGIDIPEELEKIEFIVVTIHLAVNKINTELENKDEYYEF